MTFKVPSAYELEADPFPWLTERFRQAGALVRDDDDKPTVPALSAFLGLLGTIVTSESENKQRFSIRFATTDEAYTDGNRALVTIGMAPLLDTDLTDGQRVAIMVALTLHEVGHVSWSMNARERLAKQFDFSDPKREYWVMKGHNLVHDIMLEYLQGLQAPGYAPTFVYKEAYLATNWKPDLSTREGRWDACIGAMLYGRAHDWSAEPEFKAWADDFAARCRDRRAYSYTPYLAQLLGEFIEKVGWDEPDPPAPEPETEPGPDDTDDEDDESEWEESEDEGEGGAGDPDEDDDESADDPAGTSQTSSEDEDDASEGRDDEDDSGQSVSTGEPDWDDEEPESDDTDDDNGENTLPDEGDDEGSDDTDDDNESVDSEDFDEDPEEDTSDDLDDEDRDDLDDEDDEDSDDEGDDWDGSDDDSDHDGDDEHHGDPRKGASAHETLEEEMSGEAPTIHGDLKDVEDAEEWQSAIDSYDSTRVAERDKLIIGGGLFSPREVRIKRAR